MSDAAKRALAHEGYDPVFGARPLKRVIQKRLQNRLAKELLEGRVVEGDAILVDHDGTDFAVEKRVPEAVAAEAAAVSGAGA